MSNQQKQQQFGNDEDEDIHSMDGEWSLETNIVGVGKAKQNEERNPKIALLEANNKILEGKLENLALQAQIRAMTEEANLNKLKEENKATREQMKTAEQKANTLAASMQEMQKKMEESAKEMIRLKELLKSQAINSDQIKSDVSWTGLIIKDKKLANPQANRWEWEDESSTGIKISANGLTATNNNDCFEEHSFAEEKFCLSVDDCRKDNFAGIIIYYFEVTQMSSKPFE